MEPYEVTVHRAMQWVAVVIVAANLPLSVVALIGDPHVYRPHTAGLILLTLGALLLAAAGLCLASRDATTVLRISVLIGYGTLLLHPWLTAGSRSTAYPPMFHVLGALVCLSAVFGVRSAVCVIPVFAAGVAAVRSPAIGLTQASTEALLLALSAYIATGCVAAVLRANRTVHEAVNANWVLREEASRTAQRSLERQRWDVLVHDKVLGTLRTAFSSPCGFVEPDTRELAVEALAAFHGDPGEGLTDPEGHWRGVARRLGLDATIDVTGSLPDPAVREALVGAASEAMTNVARHSDQTRVDVRATFTDTTAEVTVEDRGRGFTPDNRHWRVGLALSVSKRMENIGGSAHVHSKPGQGTRVSLAWEAPPSRARETPNEWQLRTFTPLMVLGGASVALNSVLGAPQWLAARSVAVSVLGLACVAVLTVAATVVDPRSTPAPAVPLGVVGCAMLLASNTPADAPIAWRYWYLGALTASIGAISFRYRAGVGMATAAVLPMVVIVEDWIRGNDPLAVLGGPVPVLLGTAAAGHLLRRALDLAWQRVAATTARDAELRLQIVLDKERSEEAALRVQALAAAIQPSLSAISATSQLSTAQLSELRHLEAAVRDQLSAPALLDGSLVQVLAAARSRRVRVDLITAGSTAINADQASGELGVVRALLLQVLASAPPESRVRLSWRSFPGSTTSTISMVGDGASQTLERLTETVKALQKDGLRAKLTGDQDHLLIDISLRSSTEAALADPPPDSLDDPGVRQLGQVPN